MTFAINHVGHALLFYLLRPQFANECRIVITASGTHDPAQKTAVPDAAYNTAEELAHPTPETAKNSGRQRYATSKLCNIMWMYALHKRLTAASAGRAWTVTAFDPGLMPGTGLARDSPAAVLFIWHNILPRVIPVLRFVFGKHNIHSPRESGLALARLAVDGVAEGGKYWEGTKVIKSSEMSYDTAKQEDLWRWTIDRVALNEEEKRDFDRVYPSA
jgi:NAD(P)-dependent dehydrogenase (short-subunit alcohol dehydrogenase family)